MIKLLAGLFAAGKLSKVLLTCGTMLISMVIYAQMYGWQYAVGFVLLIFVHEMGHYLAAKQRGLNVGAPTFIPFVGAWIDLKEQPMNVETEAYVAFAGPVAGTLGAMVCYFVARDQHSDLLLALAYSGCMLNLFNLIPVSPLDGGRITAILSPKIWLLGLPLLVALFFFNGSPMIILIGILAYPQIKEAIWPTQRTAEEHAQYYTATFNQRANYGALYLGLVAFLAVMTFEIHGMLPGAHH